MTQPSSRKQFFAKLLGGAAAASVLPKALANPAGPATDASAGRSGRKIQIRGDARAVARRELI